MYGASFGVGSGGYSAAVCGAHGAAGALAFCAVAVCPGAHGHRRPGAFPVRCACPHHALPCRVGQLSGMAAGGFFRRRGIFPGHRRHAGSHRQSGGHRGTGPGAAFRGCPLPQRVLPLQLPLHRRAGSGPRR